MQVTLRSGEGEVPLDVGTAVLLRDDVLDLVGDERLIGLAGVAVFATITRPLSDQPPRCGPNHVDGLLLRTERALA